MRRDIEYRGVPAGIAPGVLEIPKTTGPEGPQGPAGADGADGAPGAPGANGVAAFWRWDGYMLSIGSNLTLDGSWWNDVNAPFTAESPNNPGSQMVYHDRHYIEGVGGTILRGYHQHDWAVWLRLGLTSVGATSFTLQVPNVDNNQAIFLQKPGNGAGTVSAGGTGVTGTGTAFSTDFAVGDCIVLPAASGMTGGRLLRITVVGSNTSLTLAESSVVTVPSLSNYQIAKKINSWSNQVAQTPVDYSTTVNLANGNSILHIFANNDTLQAAYGCIIDALLQAGISWYDAGAVTIGSPATPP